MKNHFSAALQCCGLCVFTAVPTTRSRQEDHKCLSPSASSAKTLLHTPLSSVHTHTRAHTHTHTHSYTHTHTCKQIDSFNQIWTKSQNQHSNLIMIQAMWFLSSVSNQEL